MNNNVSFDAVLQMAARESIYRQLDSFPSPKDLENMYSPSYAHENKINKIIRKENRSEKLVQFNKYFTKVAVILFITFSVTFTPLITAEAVRESIVQTIIEWKDEFASIFFKSERTPVVINEVKINYIPEGFESEGATLRNEYVYKEIYYSDNGYIIVEVTFLQNKAEHIDNENSEYYSIIIDDEEGIWVYRENFSKLIISDNNFVYSVEGNIDIREIINIYTNIEIF